MKYWQTINKEIRKVSDPEEFINCILPFQIEINNTLKVLKTNNVNVAYRDIRARLMQDLRVSLALLSAAAYEEEIILKGSGPIKLKK